MRVSITEAKMRWFEMIDRVEAGETITITRYGKPVVDIRPHAN